MAVWRLVFGVAIGIIALAPATLAADLTAGTIKICRVPASSDVNNGKRIQIPMGASFGDTGQVNDSGNGGSYWPLWIATTEPTTIDAAACSTVRARVTSDFEHHRVRALDRRLFVQSSAGRDGLKGWPEN